jgi:hypothetical protein
MVASAAQDLGSYHVVVASRDGGFGACVVAVAASGEPIRGLREILSPLRNSRCIGCAERPSSDEEDLNDDEASDDETDDANQYHSRLAFSDSDDDEDADGDEDEDIEEIERRLAAEGQSQE